MCDKERPSFWSILLALLLGWWVVPAQADAATYSVIWSQPTQFTDGTAITGPVSYQLYVGPKGQEVKYKTVVTAPPYVLVPTPPSGVTCVYVTATVAGVESAPSIEVCATISAPVPKPPTAVTATVK